MAVVFSCIYPEKLLDSFYKSIDDGSIETWIYDEDGDFTHNATQWFSKAWFRPKINEDNLKFFIISSAGNPISSEIYAIYHGRLAETFLAHFDDLFTGCGITAMPIYGDILDG